MWIVSLCQLKHNTTLSDGKLLSSASSVLATRSSPPGSLAGYRQTLWHLLTIVKEYFVFFGFFTVTQKNSTVKTVFSWNISHTFFIVFDGHATYTQVQLMHIKVCKYVLIDRGVNVTCRRNSRPNSEKILFCRLLFFFMMHFIFWLKSILWRILSFAKHKYQFS